MNKWEKKEKDTFKLDSTLRAKSEIEKESDDKQNTINELWVQIREAIKSEEQLKSHIKEIERNLGCEKEKVQMLSESRDKYMIEL